MNWDQKLKLQAWVDGELSESEARQVAALVEDNREAREVVAELRLTRDFMTDNEPVARLTENGDFYWSKIRREIERQAPAAELEPSRVQWWLAWRRLLAPVSGLALIAFVSVLSISLFNRSQVSESLQHLVEVENLSEDIDSISYKSQSENMFVVYLYAKEQASESDADLEPMDDDDSILQ
jgi:anti-sigma factor RsiW